jgi:single-strand DNA-binding protein
MLCVVNSVNLIGTLTDDPTVGRNRAGIEECRMRLAVPRRARGGRREPGVVYVEVTTFGLEAQECAERLTQGSVIGLSGRLEVDDRDAPHGDWLAQHDVPIDQLDVLDGVPRRAG